MTDLARSPQPKSYRRPVRGRRRRHVARGCSGLERLIGVRPSRASGAAHRQRNGPLNGELRFEGKLRAGLDRCRRQGNTAVARRPAGATLELDRVAGTIGGNKVQGRLALSFGDSRVSMARIEAETLDAPAMIAAAIGMRGRGRDAAGWSSEPFAPGASDLAGRIEFKAERATISSAVAGAALRGVARFGPPRWCSTMSRANSRMVASAAGWPSSPARTALSARRRWR